MWLDDNNDIPYKIKSEIDKINHFISQVSRETGLVLAPLILKKDGFQAISLRQVVELTCPESSLSSPETKQLYETYDWHEIPYLDLRCYFRDIWVDLSECRQRREEQLPDFQRAWDRVENHGEGVWIHYGLRSAVVSIPLETLIKYQIFIKKSSYEELDFDAERGLLILRYAYQCQLRGCNALDDRADFLRWKIAEYYKAQTPRAELVELNTVLRSFGYWENQTFPASTASS